jgi:hypothetical protein
LALCLIPAAYDITAASALVSIFGMGSMVVLAAGRLMRQNKLATD